MCLHPNFPPQQIRRRCFVFLCTRGNLDTSTMLLPHCRIASSQGLVLKDTLEFTVAEVVSPAGSGSLPSLYQMNLCPVPGNNQWSCTHMHAKFVTYCTYSSCALEDCFDLPTVKEMHLVGSEDFPISLFDKCKNVKKHSGAHHIFKSSFSFAPTLHRGFFACFHPFPCIVGCDVIMRLIKDWQHSTWGSTLHVVHKRTI